MQAATARLRLFRTAFNAGRTTSKGACLALLFLGLLGLLGQCEPAGSTPKTEPGVARTPRSPGTPASLYVCPVGRREAWRGPIDGPGWLASWDPSARVINGQSNAEVARDAQLGNVLRVHYPAGSSSQSFADQGHPVGGLEVKPKLPALESLVFSYSVRFAPNFPWVKGGKLPGVCGGSCPSGGKLVTGQGGWSMRLMWRPDGAGEEYAYILPPLEYGTELGRGEWTFQAGVWHHLTVEIVLNTGGAANGLSRVWFDADTSGPPTFEATGLTFRLDQTPADTLFFSTFFGGHDATWATPVDTFADFAGFVVCR